jgi:hypothetical protein
MIKKFLSRISTGLIASVVTIAAFTTGAYASPITARSVTIGSSVPSAVTTYNFAFSIPSSTLVKSIDFQACQAATGTCVMPVGFANASQALASQPTGLGSGGSWVVPGSPVTGDLQISNATNTGTVAGAAQVKFTTITNPSALNSTFFFRITTWSTATWTTAIDTGTVATSTAGAIQVTANVDEALTFTLAAATVALGTLTTSTTGSGTSSMTASTNAGTGYSITVNGTTLTAPGGTISALVSPTASAQNSSQFGLNLVANTTPAVGTAVSGSGSGAPQTGYSTVNSYKFVTGDTVAAATSPTNSNTFTTSYIANISGATLPGSYSTNLTYVATANF